MATPLRMPQLGESVVEGTVGQWLKAVGDPVDKYEPLLEVVTDKVDTEITATARGTLLQIYADEGETIEAGRLLAFIGEEGEPVPERGSPEALEIVHPHSAEKPVSEEPGMDQKTAPTLEPATAPAVTAESEKPELASMRISPVVARIATEHDVDLTQVAGSGRGGRVTKKDVLNYIEIRDATSPRDQKPGEFFHPPGAKPEGPIRSAEIPSPDSAAPTPPPAAQPGDVLALTPMRRAIAEHMVRSVHTSPHVSTIFEVDCSRVIAHREANRAGFGKKGVKLTFTPYFVLATVEALKRVPVVNSTFTEEGIQLRPEINVGVAVAVEEGLIVPVIKRADERSLLGTARAVNDLAERARGRQLQPDEVQGGTFTITNHGVSGSLFATPIINQPQAAILGVGTIQKRVVVLDDDAIAVRPMAYMSLTFDHRILDGAVADRFMVVLKQTLETWPS
jgi:2-oxoisovalerate dehydrogenase E2 component (dihydrolipoyl transacylase)